VMIVGCYTMDLYCDDPEHIAIYGQQPQWTGRDLAECKREAKRDGWTFFTPRGDPPQCRCPVCSKRKGKR